MPFSDAIRVGAAGASTGHEVERSIRLNRSDNAKFSKTFSSAGNRKKWTFSVWAKFFDPYDSNTNQIFSYQQGHVNHRGSFYKGSSGVLNYQLRVSGSRKAFVTTDAQLRDPSAWYHIVLVIDSDQGSSTNRVKMYINGVQQSVVYHDTPTSGFETWINSTQTLYLGAAADENGGNMYLAEINFIDGQAYDPSYFGETNSLTGQWVPIKYTGSYTGNSFYLKFDDNSDVTATTLGKDSSGLGNNWTPNNFEVGTGVGNDSVLDTPTNNFPTLNPLYNPVNTTFGEGNLLMRGGDNFAASTFLLPKSGKWYAEFSKYNNGALQSISVTRANTAMTNYAGYLGLADNVEYVSNGELGNRTRGSTSDATVWTNDANIIVAVAVDMDNGAVYFARANTWQNSGDPTSGSSKTGAIATDLLTDNNGDHVIAVHGYNGSNSYGLYANFGQQPFTYTPPTGYKALNSQNLPDPTILKPNKHFAAFTYTGTGSSGDVVNITNSDVDFTPDWVWVKTRDVTNDHILSDSVRGGTKYLVSSEAYAEQTNTQKIRAFIENGFESGTDGDTNWTGSRPFVAWNWNAGDTDGKTYTVKVVSDSGNKYRFDDFGTSAVTLDLAEGGTYTFDQSDSSMSSHPMQLSTTANGTHGGGSAYSTGVTYELDGSTVTASAFISGFSSASSRKLIITVAASAPTLYYYCYYHSGMGGAVNTNTTLGSSNFDGTVQSTAKVNASAGFSIVTLNGTGSVLTFGHGLGVKPDAVILKARNIANNWLVFHQGYGATTTTFLDTTGTTSASSAWYNNTEPTSSVFTLGTWTGMNTSTPSTIVAYCFSEVEGYSKFGSYTANGNSNGTFVFTGFRPALIIFKNSTSTEAWSMFDNKRDPINPVEKFLRPSGSNTDTSGSNDIDFLSNGFKARTSNNPNVGTNTYIYLAFAELPFKNSGAR